MTHIIGRIVARLDDEGRWRVGRDRESSVERQAGPLPEMAWIQRDRKVRTRALPVCVVDFCVTPREVVADVGNHSAACREADDADPMRIDSELGCALSKQADRTLRILQRHGGPKA